MNSAVGFIEKIIALINGLVWSPFMLTVLLGTGLYFSARSGFMQIFKLKAIIKEIVSKCFKKTPGDADRGAITPFQALSTALAGTIGTGNIAGVATALTIAGPGAIFWMWVSALVGMMTKYAEIVLAIKFRRKNPKGEWIGGPMFYIGEGLKMKHLAFIYAFLGVVASFGAGNMAQSNSVSSAMEEAFGIPPLLTGMFLAVFVGITVAGGVKKIAAVAGTVVPLMSLFYMFSAVVVLLINIIKIPAAVALIMKSAFTASAPAGGFMGATVAAAIRKGTARGIFTNEAGLGSASIAHASADTDHPFRQGLWGIFEVFFDTIVMCSITAFAILVTDKWTEGLTGTALTVSAFNSVIDGLGSYTIPVSLLFFAFSSVLAWAFYGRKCLEYIGGERYARIYLFVFISAIIAGATAKLELVWELSDALNGLMLIPNIIGLIGLSGIVVRETRDGQKRIRL
ncbi:MAG: Amino-acid carrier protein AlsT [Firmicutes bacterium ADurb.Bin193]|nr:MAG: Amino-acid carrier protein AlsT [Firmicutes bacterium ADurb.Bin193]